MVDSSGSSIPLPAAELVRARIADKRVFEARFLFKKFSSTITAEDRLQLQRILERTIKQAEQSFSTAEKLAEQQQYEAAEREYSRVKEAVVDFPAIDQALQRVALAGRFERLHPAPPPGDDDPAVSGKLPANRYDPADINRESTTTKYKKNPNQCQVGDRSRITSSDQSSFIRSGMPYLSAGALVTAVLVAWAFQTFFHAQNPVPGTAEHATPHVIAHKITVQSGKNSVQPVVSGRSTKKEKPIYSGRAIVLPPAIASPIVKNIPDVHSEKISHAGAGDSFVKKNHGRKDTVLVTTKDLENEAVVRVVCPVSEQVVSVRDENIVVVSVPEDKGKNSKQKNEKKVEPRRTTEQRQKAGEPVENGSSVVGAHGKRFYTVLPGDTLESIADRMYGDRYQWSAIVRANQKHLGREPYVLSVGMKLIIPALDKLAGIHVAHPIDDDGMYIVQSGDSLGRIALKVYGTSRKWQKLYALNRDRLASPSALRVGQKLRVVQEKDASVDVDPVGE